MSSPAPVGAPAINWEPVLSKALQETKEIPVHLRLGEVIKNIKAQKPELQGRTDLDIASVLARQLNTLRDAKTKDSLIIALKNWERLRKITPEARQKVATAEQQFTQTALPKILGELGERFKSLLQRMSGQPEEVKDRIKSLQSTFDRLIKDVYTLPELLKNAAKLTLHLKEGLTEIEVKDLPEDVKKEIKDIKEKVIARFTMPRRPRGGVYKLRVRNRALPNKS